MEVLIFILVGGLIIGVLKHAFSTANIKRTTTVYSKSTVDPKWTSQKQQRQKEHQKRVESSKKRSASYTSQSISPQISPEDSRARIRKRLREQQEEDLLKAELEFEEKIQYSGGFDVHEELPVEKALEWLTSEKKSYVYKLSVGGLDYIGFTSQKPEIRLEQHIQDAKNMSSQKVHVQLRKFGYLNDFEVISEHKNEILGLVAEISSINKLKPELNTSKGGEGNIFTVFEKHSLQGEFILFVRKNELNREQSYEGS